MLFRFCLYGFLKNQRYFEAFFLLIFIQKNLSFTLIGLLIGFREIGINVLEIPSGAIADVLGRRKSMVVSFVAYILSFLLFGISDTVWLLFVAMFFYSIGEAFRTGTHKAIIFNWLLLEDRETEKTAIYGYTRSWSQLGSALSVIIASGMVFVTKDYSIIFLYSIIPCVLNIINFMGYPKYLDGPVHRSEKLSTIIITLLSAVKLSIRSKKLRRILTESMGYEGLYKTTKDYLQPVIQSTALAIPFLLDYTTTQRTSVLIGVIYFLLYILSSIASRKAGYYVKKIGNEQKASNSLWLLNLLVFILLMVGIGTRYIFITIFAFILLAVLQNFWRPIIVSRCASCSDHTQTATVLSIESQAKSLFVAIAAPLLGFLIDTMETVQPDFKFLPLAILGIIIPTLILLTGKRQ